VAVDAAPILAATALFLLPDIFPGVLLYGVLVSIAIQLWSLILGILMWRRAVRDSLPTAQQ
jgi:hypothetical protein